MKIKKLWHQIVHLGVRDTLPSLKKKQVMLANQLAVIFLFALIIGITINIARGRFFVLGGQIPFFLLLILNFILNRQGYIKISSILFATLPPFLFLAPILFIGKIDIGNFITLPFVFLMFSLIPVLIFGQEEQKINWPILVLHFLLLVFFDRLLIFFAKNYLDLSPFEGYYFLYKVPPIVLWVFIVGGFEFYKSLNSRFEEQLEESNQNLRIKNHKLLSTEEELRQLIEELQAIQEVLSLKQAETSSILKAINENFYVSEFDFERRLIFANQLLLQLTGLSFEDIKGKKHEELFQSLSSEPSIVNDNWETIQQGHSLNVETQTISHQNQKVYFSETLAPIVDLNGRTVKVLNIALNVTDRKEQQLKIRQLNEDLTDKIKKIEQQNEEVSRLYKKLKSDEQFLFKAYRRLKISEKKIQEQNQEIAQRNEELTNQKAVLKGQNMELEKALTQLKETQSQLVQSEKMVSSGILTAGIAHELNNPINFIHSGVSGLENGLRQIIEVVKKYDAIRPDGNYFNDLEDIKKFKESLKFDRLIETAERVIQNIGIGAQKTADIVKELRTFSRLEENDAKKTNIHEGLESVLLLLHNQYKNHLEIVRDYGEIPLIECYPGKLNQVFMNLILNAIQAMEGRKGKITISTQSSEQKVKIQISDEGTGISEDIKARIFEPFFTTKKVGQGTGLGLSISMSIVRDHHGAISVESTVNQGTTFTVLLPKRLQRDRSDKV